MQGEGLRRGYPASVVEGIELIANLGVDGHGEQLVDGNEKELQESYSVSSTPQTCMRI